MTVSAAGGRIRHRILAKILVMEGPVPGTHPGMSTPNRSRAHRALGIAVASVVAATPSIGCTAVHMIPEDDAAQSADASMPVDAVVAQADTGPAHLDAANLDAANLDAANLDAGSPTDAQPAVDAWAAQEDADAPDAYYYPDGVRG